MHFKGKLRRSVTVDTDCSRSAENTETLACFRSEFGRPVLFVEFWWGGIKVF